MPLSRARLSLQDIGQLLKSEPSRLEFAMRLAIICTLTVLVVEIYQTPEPALTAYMVFFLNRENRTISLIMNVVFLLLITVLIGVLFVVTMAVADDPMWRVASIAALSFGLLFLASASKLRPVGAPIIIVIGYALDLLGGFHLGEIATRSYLYAWLFVGIPAGVSIVINFLLAPSPRSLAEQAIALRLTLSATMLRAPDNHVRHGLRKCLREGAAQIYGWLELADREKTSPVEDIEALRQAADSTVLLLVAIDVMDRIPEAALPNAQRESLSGTLDKIAAVLTSGGYPTKINWQVTNGKNRLSPLAAEILADIKEVVTRFAEPSDRMIPAQEPPKEKQGFFVEDAFTNPDHLHYALKTTAAAMFCYLFYSLLDWPGIHTCFITCYVVSLGTTAETVEKLTLRILGCLIGAAVGIAAIVYLVPSFTSIGALMAVVFVGAYAAAYVAGGGPRISYAGFQIAFAFFLCVIQGAAPAFDMTIARDRVIGILVGNLVVYLVFSNLWPVSVGKRIDPAIAALLRRLGTMMKAADPATRRALASQAQSGLGAIETDIRLAEFEPGTVRPSESWLATRREAAIEIGALESALLLSADRETTASAHIADRLGTLAARFDHRESPPPAQYQGRNIKWSGLLLYPIIDKGLRRLEDVPI